MLTDDDVPSCILLPDIGPSLSPTSETTEEAVGDEGHDLEQGSSEY